MIKSFLVFLKEKYLHEITDKKIKMFIKTSEEEVPCISEEFDFSSITKNFKSNLNEFKKIDTDIEELRFFILFNFNSKKLFIVSWPAKITHDKFLTILDLRKDIINDLKIPVVKYKELYNKSSTTPSKFDLPDNTLLLFPGLFDGIRTFTSILVENFENQLKGISLVDCLPISGIHSIKNY